MSRSLRNSPGLDALPDDLLPTAFIFFRGEADLFAKALLHRLAFAQIDEKVRVVAVERFQMRRDRPTQLFRRCPLGGGDFADRAVHLRDRLLDHEIEKLFLAVEVVVEAALEDANLVGDVADSGGMIALGPKYLRRGRNDVFEGGHSPASWLTSLCKCKLIIAVRSNPE